MKIKGWELMKKIADGEIKENQKIKMIFNESIEENFIFDGIDIISEKARKNIFDIHVTTAVLKMNFELIEDEKDIDDIEEVDEYKNEMAYDWFDIQNMSIKINQLIKAVKQLNKKLEGK